MVVKASPALVLSSMYVTPQKYFSHPSVVVYIFATPTNKTETGTANRWGTSNSKPPGQSCCAMYQPPQSLLLFFLGAVKPTG
jgi:hypothetical protein